MLYIIGFPVLLWFLMFINRNECTPLRLKQCWDLLTKLKHQFWWFEILLIGRRIAIVTILSVAPIVFGQESVLMILSSFLLLFLFCILKEDLDEVTLK